MLGACERGAQLQAAARAGARDMRDLPLTDQARGELRGTTVLTARATKNQRIPTILHERLRFPSAVRAGYLRDRLKAEDAAPAELAQPCKSARELVVLTVGYNYLLAISYASRIETADAQLKTAEALYNQASDRLSAGTSPQIDALRAKVEFQTRRQQLIAARNDFEKQRLALARTIGLPAGQPFELTEKIPYDKPQPISIDAALQQAYSTRPDFQAAQAQLRSAELARRAAFAEYYPTLSFDGNYGAGGATPAHLNGTFEAQGSLKIPIFQGGKVHADTLKADANLTNSRNQMENLRGQIDQDVRDAILDLQSAAEQVEVAESNIDLAGQTLDQARDRFIAGVTDNIEVVQAQDSVASANESYISSLFDYTVARISLARAEGIAETGVLNYLRGKGNATKDGH